MCSINNLLDIFTDVANNPKKQLNKYLAENKKAIGCFPYYVPEELVQATGMVPFGIWGCRGTINAAKEYFASFYCTIAQMSLEMGLNGTLDGLSGVIATSLCDTLRPFTQNFRVAVPQLPFMFLAHPQNRREEYGIKYTISQYTNIKAKLEEISGEKITDEKLKDAIAIYNKSRSERRRFVKLAGQHPEAITAVQRSAVLKSAHFMLKEEHTMLLKELNDQLESFPLSNWKGVRIVTSGIVVDNPRLLEIFDEHNIAIAADDVAHESRGFRIDVPDNEDPMRALALHFANQDMDVLLYDPEINKRPKHIVDMVKESNADGVVILMMQFCDPEEIEFPSLKKGLEEANIPYIMIGVDQQMTDFGQARTSVQAFSDLLAMRR